MKKVVSMLLVVTMVFSFLAIQALTYVKAESPTAYFTTTFPTGGEVFSPSGTIHVTWDVEGFTGTEGNKRSTSSVMQTLIQSGLKSSIIFLLKTALILSTSPNST
ncbi:MAG: hypothetical protein QXE05_10030 [Nitrososphaeria archaeon]